MILEHKRVALSSPRVYQGGENIFVMLVGVVLVADKFSRAEISTLDSVMEAKVQSFTSAMTSTAI